MSSDSMEISEFFSPSSPSSPGKSTSTVVGNPSCQSTFNEPSTFAARCSVGILSYMSMWELSAYSLTESPNAFYVPDLISTISTEQHTSSENPSSEKENLTPAEKPTPLIVESSKKSSPLLTRRQSNHLKNITSKKQLVSRLKKDIPKKRILFGNLGSPSKHRSPNKKLPPKIYSEFPENKKSHSVLSQCPKKLSRRHTTSNPDTIIVPSASKNDTPAKYWIRGLNLSLEDRNLLEHGDWLNDKHIRSVNELLQRQFPSQNGLQDSLVLFNLLSYSSGVEKFVQIINIACNHWLCISNKLSPSGTIIEVYDSLPSYSTNSLQLCNQAAAILKTSYSSFQIKHVDVQRQSGGSDCALFAIAFATTLCMDDDPHTSSYNQSAMRSHLMNCFNRQQMSLFPAADRQQRSHRQRFISTQTVPVYCVCRLPWNKHDFKRGPLVCCSVCGEWFHHMCLGIDQKIFNDQSSIFICKVCEPSDI